ncbi:azurin [Shewanella sp. D64]|uniref:azurin n=1 Tax=unclassified Shewanella TaxID=196818 RepID=UPI0022BA606B|nr:MULTISPECIES: azurin [unclassified Shewanella]MEC4725135.1 azurin [Shewanella sp. D64]MEC4737036.1 azurin [Shewanella sp. E94]WBJ98100.1 azurin [Shewanella sp. MTB7]
MCTVGILGFSALFSLSFSAIANANECELAISANDMMQFDVKALSIPASCKEVTLTLTHAGQLPKAAMGHNWVLTKSTDMSAVANEGMGAGAVQSYVKQDDKRVIAHTEIVGGGDSTSITFSTEGMSPSEAYKFFCSFPGHWAIMQGDFVIEA